MDKKIEGCDNILFIVEGKKSEKNYIQIIYEHFYPDEYIQINRSDGKIINQDLINMPILDINWIENANINAFVEAIKFDEYGVSPVNYFKHKNDVKTYSEAYILVDADLKDKGSSSENAKEKIALLMELSEIVSNSDENIEVLISSPMLECIGDNQDEYEYVSGESYKKNINKQFPSGVNGHFKANIEDVLLMNVKKYQNDDVDYSNQSLFPLEEYDFEHNKIKVRSPLFHLIASKEMLYGETELVIEFLNNFKET